MKEGTRDRKLGTEELREIEKKNNKMKNIAK